MSGRLTLNERLAIKRILLARTDRIGDLLMNLPAIQAVRRGLPEAQVTLLVRKGLEVLFKAHPDVHQILTWDPAEGSGWRGIFRWAWRLRKNRFDAAVILNPTRLFHIASFLAGIPVRIGYRRKWGVLLTASLEDTKTQRSLHEAEYNLELVHLLGVDSPLGPFGLSVSPQAAFEVDRLLVSLGLPASCRPVAIHPWTSNPAKGWPQDSFREVALRLSRGGERVLMIGEPGSASSHGRSWIDAPPGIMSLVGQVPLALLPALMKRCGVLLSNDSGPVHIAAAVGTSTVVVAPRAHARLLARWRPLGNGHVGLLSPTVEEVVAATLKVSCL